MRGHTNFNGVALLFIPLLWSGRTTCKLIYIHIFNYLFIVSFSKYHYIKCCRYLDIFAKFQSKMQENKQDITNSSTQEQVKFTVRTTQFQVNIFNEEPRGSTTAAEIVSIIVKIST